MTTDHPSQNAPPTRSTGPDPLIGEVIDGRYRVTKKLGEGGMGEVYAAEHVHIEKRVAIKLLRREIVTNEEALARFAQEARSASSIGHENIIRIEDFGKIPDGRVYLCMELLDGAQLKELAEQQALSAIQLLDILIQTGMGLGAAHQKGVVHRDMKPENIFVTRDVHGREIPKLLDFGIAKVSGADGQNHLTRTGTIFGTPFYMSPEQALGQAVDHRADIYAMGVIMYELFSGSLPFSGESFMGILTKHITAEPPPIEHVAQQNGRVLVPGIAEVIERCMKKDPDHRFQTMRELVQALIHVRQSVGSGAMPIAYGPRSTKLAAVAPPGGMTPPPGSQPWPVTAPGYAPAPTPTPAPMMAPPYYQAQSQPSTSQAMHAIGTGRSAWGKWLLVLMLVIGAGATATYLYLDQNKKAGNGTAKKGGRDVVTPANDAAVAATPEAGTDSPVDAAVAATEPDAGAAEEKDAGQVAEVDAGADHDAAVAAATDAGTPDEPEQVFVYVYSLPDGAECYVDGTLSGTTPTMVPVTPGKTVQIKLALAGYKVEEFALDGSKNKIVQRLKKKGGTTPTHTTPTDTTPFCSRPENKDHVNCLDRADCRRPENRRKPWCLANQLE